MGLKFEKKEAKVKLDFKKFKKGFPTILSRGGRSEIYEIKLTNESVKQATLKKSTGNPIGLEWLDAKTGRNIPFLEVIGWRD